MHMIQDIRLALRTLGRAPSVAAITILSIALGVGMTAVVFAAVKAVLIEPFPYSHPENLVQIRTDSLGGDNPQQDWVSWPDMRDVARRNRSFSAIETYRYAIFNLAGDSGALPEALYGLRVSAGMFSMPGVSPKVGRTFSPEETQPGRDREIILSYGLWVRRFHADPKVVGHAVTINGHDFIIIGVMHEGFDFPMRLATSVTTPSRHMDFWAPDAIDPSKERRDATGYGAVARLRDRVTLTQARQELAAIAAGLAHDYPDSDRGRTPDAAYLRDRTLGFSQTGLLLLLGASAVFLLISCANVANLLLTRALGRQHEIAIRAALGAGRGRIVGQLVTESIVLGALGGIGGYALALLAWGLLPRFTPMSIPRLETARADGSVFAFALLLSVVTGILAGIAPAFRVSVRGPGDALRQGGVRGVAGSSHNRLRALLLVSEVSVSLVLVVVGGSLTGKFIRLLGTDPGFTANRVLASIIVPSGERYQDHPENRTSLFRGILESVRLLPGVESAGTVNALPFSGDNILRPVAATDAAVQSPDTQPAAEIDRVSAGYLEAMGLRLLSGRWLRDDDMGANSDVVIVNEIAARRLWPDRSALSARICLDCGPGRADTWMRVIGVVSSVRHAALDDLPGLQVYIARDALASAGPRSLARIGIF
jgi:putative ABC transport system permease protein